MLWCFNAAIFMEKFRNNWLKYIIGFVLCFLIRLIPIRAPNVEPILATQMPFARSYGKIAGFLFAFLSIIVYDLFTFRLGIWTLITGFVYGALGIWAVSYFKNKKNNSWNYIKFAIMGTLVFDILTGLSIGPLFFGQTFMGALIGQIPFTALHLAGNITFAGLLSPFIYKFVIKNENFETRSLLLVLKTKES